MNEEIKETTDESKIVINAELKRERTNLMNNAIHNKLLSIKDIDKTILLMLSATISVLISLSNKNINTSCSEIILFIITIILIAIAIMSGSINLFSYYKLCGNEEAFYKQSLVYLENNIKNKPEQPEQLPEIYHMVRYVFYIFSILSLISLITYAIIKVQ